MQKMEIDVLLDDRGVTKERVDREKKKRSFSDRIAIKESMATPINDERMAFSHTIQAVLKASLQARRWPSKPQSKIDKSFFGHAVRKKNQLPNPIQVQHHSRDRMKNDKNK